MDNPEIPDAPSGAAERERLEALAGRVGPSQRQAKLPPWAALAFLGLVSAGTTLVSFQLVLNALVHSRKEVTVPDLTGKTLEQALDVLAPLNLSLSKEAVEHDETFPPGAILRQAPPVGLKVREGKVVRVTLSSGGQVLFVPSLAGKTLTEAQNQIRAAGILLGAMSEIYSTEHEAGWVIDQNPAAGSVMRHGAMVDLKVSKGPPPEGMKIMPDFVQKPYAKAQEWARKNGITPAVEQVNSDNVLPGHVVRQRPAADMVLKDGVAVSFFVSRSTTVAAATNTVRYHLPAGSDRVQVRIVMRDEDGEREIFQEYQNGGAELEVPVSPHGVARIRIFVNGVLTEEQLLQ